MAGHIFDANTLRNFALMGSLGILANTLGGSCYVAKTVMEELRQGARLFPQRNRHRLDDPLWANYISRFQTLEADLARLGFRVLSVSTSAEHRELLGFLACLLDEDVMDPGEAESFALAAYRDLVLYSDEQVLQLEGSQMTPGEALSPGTIALRVVVLSSPRVGRCSFGPRGHPRTQQSNSSP